MAPRKPFFAGMNKTQTAAAIRQIINPVPLRQEFESELLADLIEQKHYYCARHGLRPSRFRKLPHAVGEYELQGWFDGREKWHSVSWHQCVYPRRDPDWIGRALRDVIAPDMARHKRAHPTCERCGAAPAEEVHHVAPTFREIVSQAIGALSEPDWQAIVDRFDWWSDAPFSLPESSPALGVLRAEHENAHLSSVCQPCHEILERGSYRIHRSPGYESATPPRRRT